MKKWIIVGALILASIAGFVVYRAIVGESAGPLAGVEVDWRLLNEMDYISGKASKELSDLNDKMVKVPGFMVPLEDNQKSVTEFLLVPNAQACIHVPPPPPNQMIYVKMKRGAEFASEPIWVYGKFHIATQNSKYGDASFEILGEGVELYK